MMKTPVPCALMFDPNRLLARMPDLGVQAGLASSRPRPEGPPALKPLLEATVGQQFLVRDRGRSQQQRKRNRDR